MAVKTIRKFCTACNQIRSIDRFSRSRATRDGHTAHCKDCRKKYEFQWGQRNRRRTQRATDRSLVQEEWRDIPRFIGSYQVSSYGRVRNIRTTGYGNYGFVRVRHPELTRNGYLRVSLYYNGQRVRRTVHSLVAAVFLGPAPTGHVINHQDGDKLNNRPENLEYCLLRENYAHAARLGLSPIGERNHFAKLRADEVLDIRRQLANGIGFEKLAREFGVTTNCIRWIAIRGTWKHLT